MTEHDYYECACETCTTRRLSPVVRAYFVITRGPGRWEVDDRGREQGYGSLDEARLALHEELVAGLECYIERKEVISTIVLSARSLGPLHERTEWWVRTWTRLGKMKAYKRNSIVPMKVAAAKVRDIGAPRL